MYVYTHTHTHTHVYNCISEIWFGKSAFVSNALSLFNHVYKHFPSFLQAFCLPLHTPKYHPLLSMASQIFRPGQGIKHWFTSKAAIKFTSFIDQWEVHHPTRVKVNYNTVELTGAPDCYLV